MTRGRNLLLSLLVIVALGLVLFYLLGGSVDIDADVRSPSVEVDGGSLPDVEVQPAGEAEAGDPE